MTKRTQMTAEEIRRWVDSYNTWVEEWNAAELDRTVPLAPDWRTATFLGPDLPRCALTFAPHGESRYGKISAKGWKPFKPGSLFEPFLRRPMDVDKVTRATWTPRA
jgi:hypothetical protein